MKVVVVLLTVLANLALAAPEIVAADFSLEDRGENPPLEEQGGIRTGKGPAGGLDKGPKSGCSGPGCGPRVPGRHCHNGRVSTYSLDL